MKINRRHLFKLALAAPLAALVPLVKKPQTLTVKISLDSASVQAMLPKIKREITRAVAEGFQRDSDRKLKELVERDIQKATRFKVYNIHNKGYRILGETPQVTHFDEGA